MNNSICDQLLKRIAGSSDTRDERITVSLNRRVLPILEKYRKREAADGNRSRRQALGEVAGELIEAADELIQRYASEATSLPQREAAEVKSAR